MNITIERLEEIENERTKTFMDPAFRDWLKQLNVSRLCTKHEGIDNAKRMMAEWDSSKYIKDCSYF